MKSPGSLPALTGAPFTFDDPHAWRTYLNGKLPDALYGRPEQEDTRFSEEWIASTVTMRNVGREYILDRGLNHPEGVPQVSLRELIESDPAAHLGVKSAQRDGQMSTLIKLVDFGKRLSTQVYSSRQQTRALFRSEYGRIECWHILDGREIDGENPAIYLDFQSGIIREYQKELPQRQDISDMLKCMHRFEVSRRNIFLIEGDTPHAIDAGCFLAEIQELTDCAIRMERGTPPGLLIAGSTCHRGLGSEKMFDCFDLAGYSCEETLEKWEIPGRAEENDDVLRTQIIGHANTSMFHMGSLLVPLNAHIRQNGEFSVPYILSGSGQLVYGTAGIRLYPGRQVFFSAGSRDCEMFSDGDGPLEAPQCFGPL